MKLLRCLEFVRIPLFPVGLQEFEINLQKSIKKFEKYFLTKKILLKNEKFFPKNKTQIFFSFLSHKFPKFLPTPRLFLF